MFYSLYALETTFIAIEIAKPMYFGVSEFDISKKNILNQRESI